MKRLLLTVLLLLASAGALTRGEHMGTAFTYQGRLTDNGTAASGSYDVLFTLHDAATGGNKIGPSVQVAPTVVTDGLLTATLDFGATAFLGDSRWLQIQVRPYQSGIHIPAPYVTLQPRQALTAAPSALHAFTAERLTGNLDLTGTAVLNFGAHVRQMLNLWGTQYGLGVQANTLYQRSHSTFAWYKDGVHADGSADAGAGGTKLMQLSGNGTLEINHTNPGYGLIVNSGIGYAALFNAQALVRFDSSLDRAHLRLVESQEGDFARLEFQSGTKPVWHLAVGGSQNQMNFWNKTNGDVMSLSQDGVLSTRVLTITGGADVAEPFDISTPEAPKGSVVIIDEQNPGRLKVSDRSYDTRVAGILSGANGVNPGISLSQQGILEGGQHVALSGRVYVRADASEAPIKPGDLLTTAHLPGHAMKVLDHARAQGAILGKAMSPLPEGTGLVLVLVTLQ
jgi:hypothetical protein